MSGGIIVPQPVGPIAGWPRPWLERAHETALLKLAQVENENEWLRRQVEQYLMTEAMRSPTIPAPPHPDCEFDLRLDAED